jgi:hypothetical protein
MFKPLSQGTGSYAPAPFLHAQLLLFPHLE